MSPARIRPMTPHSSGVISPPPGAMPTLLASVGGATIDATMGAGATIDAAMGAVIGAVMGVVNGGELIGNDRCIAHCWCIVVAVAAGEMRAGAALSAARARARADCGGGCCCCKGGGLDNSGTGTPGLHADGTNLMVPGECAWRL